MQFLEGKNLKGEYHGTAHVLAVANVIVYKPIGSDVIIPAGNLHLRVKMSLSPLLISEEIFTHSR